MPARIERPGEHSPFEIGAAAMVAVPHLAHYILGGGKGTESARVHPFAIAANASGISVSTTLESAANTVFETGEKSPTANAMQQDCDFDDTHQREPSILLRLRLTPFARLGSRRKRCTPDADPQPVLEPMVMASDSEKDGIMPFSPRAREPGTRSGAESPNTVHGTKRMRFSDVNGPSPTGVAESHLINSDIAMADAGKEDGNGDSIAASRTCDDIFSDLFGAKNTIVDKRNVTGMESSVIAGEGDNISPSAGTADAPAVRDRRLPRALDPPELAGLGLWGEREAQRRANAEPEGDKNEQIDILRREIGALKAEKNQNTLALSVISMAKNNDKVAELTSRVDTWKTAFKAMSDAFEAQRTEFEVSRACEAVLAEQIEVQNENLDYLHRALDEKADEVRVIQKLIDM